MFDRQCILICMLKSFENPWVRKSTAIVTAVAAAAVLSSCKTSQNSSEKHTGSTVVEKNTHTGTDENAAAANAKALVAADRSGRVACTAVLTRTGDSINIKVTTRPPLEDVSMHYQVTSGSGTVLGDHYGESTHFAAAGIVGKGATAEVNVHYPDGNTTGALACNNGNAIEITGGIPSK